MSIEKYIITESKEQDKMLSAIQALANLYSESGFANKILVHKLNSTKNQYVLTFPDAPNFEHFKYFVNYLHYPESGSFGVKTKGYWTIEIEEGIPKQYFNSRAMLYVSNNDTEYDNVYVAFNSTREHFKLGFARREEFVKLNSSELNFSEKTFDLSELELIQTITPNLVVVKKNKQKENLKFLLYSLLVALIILILSYVL
jgi:hypothetical protein